MTFLAGQHWIALARSNPQLTEDFNVQYIYIYIWNIGMSYTCAAKLNAVFQAQKSKCNYRVGVPSAWWS